MGSEMCIRDRCTSMYTQTHINHTAVTGARGWRSASGCCCMPLRLVVLFLCVHTLSTAPAVGQLLLKSSCPAHDVGSSFLVRVIRRQITVGNIHTLRSSAESTRNVHRNVYRLLRCVPRSRKLLLLLLQLLLCCCNLRIPSIMYDY